jgi:hypothetical protein
MNPQSNQLESLSDRRQHPVWNHFLGLLLAACLLFPGCGGCRFSSSNTASDDGNVKTEGDSPKADFDVKPAVIYPGVFKDESKNNRTKPGHWTMGSYRVKANNYDLNGRMTAAGMRGGSEEQPIFGTSFYSESVRPFSLSKGQEKNLELVIFIPHSPQVTPNSRIKFSLTGSTGLEVVGGIENTIYLKPHQYHFLVLAAEQDKYRYLRALDCTQLSILVDPDDISRSSTFYHLVFPTPGEVLPLGPSALTWTTTAYVLWDNQDPDALTTAQQQALIDWLHFGGQLIISGPGSMGNLMQSFLAPYLPGSFGEVKNLSDEDFAELNSYWATPMRKDKARRWELNIPASTPMLGVQLRLHPEANFLVGTGGLVAERRLGRGRIMMTGFPLNDPRISKWECCSSFFHNALMGKPSRTMEASDIDSVSIRFADKTGGSIFNPMFGSTLRFVSRDLGGSKGVSRNSWIDEELPSNQRSLAEISVPYIDEDLTKARAVHPLHFGGFGNDPKGGTGIWNDQVGLAEAARENISRLAGINPPKPDFVLKMLGAYLLVLVPLNWLFFRMIGRVEWAWIAMPVIAIVGAITVVRMAALDIGFLRSQSQIGVLELHGGYSRGHLTEYSGLYSSLSTIYSVNFDDNTGLALPFGARSPRQSTGGERLRAMQFEQRTENRSRNFLVNSNSTGMLHMETMTDIGGGISLLSDQDGERVQNASRLNIKDAGVVRRLRSGETQFSWIGELTADSRASLQWQAVSEDSLYNRWFESDFARSLARISGKIWDEFPKVGDENAFVELPVILNHPLFSKTHRQIRDAIRGELEVRSNASDSSVLVTNKAFKAAYLRTVRDKNADLNLGELFDVIIEELELAPGETRLIGYTLEPITATTTEPRATQLRRATLVLAHLQACPYPELTPDRDTIFDYLGRANLDRLLQDEDFEDSENEDRENMLEDIE